MLLISAFFSLEVTVGVSVPRYAFLSILGKESILPVEDEIQLKISKAGSASRFEKNSPPEVLRVIEGANHHWSRRSWFCSTEIRFLSPSALTLTKILNFLGAPKGPQNSPQRDFFMKKKWGAIDRKWLNSPRSKILKFDFFQKTLKFLCRDLGPLKKNHKIFFWKMVFKSRVQSIGNDLIRLDPIPWKILFFLNLRKFLKYFCVRPLKIFTKYFFEKWSSKVGCNG